MDDAETISARIRRDMPLVFGESEDTKDQDLTDNISTFIADSIKESESFLTPETIRYQSILLASSIFLVVLGMIDISNATVPGTKIPMTASLASLYPVFVLMLAALFATKVYVDRERHKMRRTKPTSTSHKLAELAQRRQFRSLLQLHYWSRFSNEIDRAQRSYLEALTRTGTDVAIPAGPDGPVVDIKEIRELPEMASELERLEGSLSSLTAQLGANEVSFQAKADEIIRTPKRREGLLGELRDSSHDAWMELQSAFRETLEPWFEARSALVSDQLKNSLSNDMWPHNLVTLRRRARRLQRFHTVLEVFGPLAFAALAVGSAWLHP